MTIVEIYKILNNPPNLQEHQIRTARVSLYIANYWQGEPIDKELLLSVALLHDVGNIVKFDIEKYPHFLGKEQERAEYWKSIQKEMVAKYGTDDHRVTKQMLTELGVSEEIVNTIYAMSYPNAPEIVSSDNWILKILLYSDLRVSPTGIISIRERLDDVHSRLEKYKNRQDLYESGIALENQIQEHIAGKAEDITDETTETDEEKLLQIQVNTR